MKDLLQYTLRRTKKRKKIKTLTYTNETLAENESAWAQQGQASRIPYALRVDESMKGSTTEKRERRGEIRK